VSAGRPAFYALQPGGWRDYLTLLHPPYTLWHLSYVAIGAALAPHFEVGRLLVALAAFFLAVGIGAHALDELKGHPLQTRISDRTLVWLSAVSIGGAVALGIYGSIAYTPWLAPLVAVGAFVVVAYNLELFEGALHSDLWFGLAWGAFPVLTAYFASAERLRGEVFAAAAFAVFASLAQRTLSTQVRTARRQVGDPSSARPAELALQLLSVALPLLAGALLLARSA
jgi:hypothetical protein